MKNINMNFDTFVAKPRKAKASKKAKDVKIDIQKLVITKADEAALLAAFRGTEVK